MKKQIAASVFTLLAASLATPGAAQANPEIFDNFHEVDPGQLYRSAQMNPDDLEKKFDEYKFKTIINLRGAAPGQSWFDDEAAVALKNNITTINIQYSADRIPTAAELNALLEAYATAQRPILIHCQAGADRTSEAVGVYLFDKTHGDRAVAQSAVSILYFHLEFTHPAMDYFISNVYQGAEWAKTYDPCEGDYKFFNKTALCPSKDPAK